MIIESAMISNGRERQLSYVAGITRVVDTYRRDKLAAGLRMADMERDIRRDGAQCQGAAIDCVERSH